MEGGQDFGMASNTAEKPINDVLADNLAYFMSLKNMNQVQLAAASGVSQTAIGFYLRPGRRQPSKSGKSPSAKVTELAQIAHALDIKSWQLLQDMTPRERAFYAKVEEAYRALLNGGS